MRPISSGELARKQWQVADMLQDSGVIVRQVAGVWIADAEPTRCTMQSGSSRTGVITVTPAGTPADVLYLPHDTAFGMRDRFRLTHRAGMAVPPTEWLPITQPVVDSLSMQVDVRKVTS